MGRKCVVCAASCDSKINSEKKHHSFPKDPVRKTAWLSALGIRFHLKSNTICSDHFLPEDYCSSGLLKRDAIPHKSQGRVTHQSNTAVESDPGSDQTPGQDQYGLVAVPLNIYSMSSPGHFICSSDSEEEFTPPTKKHKQFNANSIGDLTVEHFYPVRRAKQHLDMVKEKFKQKTALVKSLQMQNKRLRDKLKKYDVLIKSLQRKNFLLEKAHQLQPESAQTVSSEKHSKKKSVQTVKLYAATQEEAVA